MHFRMYTASVLSLSCSSNSMRRAFSTVSRSAEISAISCSNRICSSSLWLEVTQIQLNLISPFPGEYPGEGSETTYISIITEINVPVVINTSKLFALREKVYISSVHSLPSYSISPPTQAQVEET